MHQRRGPNIWDKGAGEKVPINNIELEKKKLIDDRKGGTTEDTKLYCVAELEKKPHERSKKRERKCFS